MAISRLTCPDCGTVLRPAKPVAPGKKVKCPKCDLIFVAGEDDDEDDAPRRKPAGKGAVKQKATPKKEEEEIYGFSREHDDEDDDDKPRIEYAPDESIRDLRGPAIVRLTPSANKLQLVGMICVLGWMALFVLLLIPTVFPIQAGGAGEKASPVMGLGPGLGAVDPTGGGGVVGFGGGGGGSASGGGSKKYDDEKGGFFEFFGIDLGVWFLVLMVPMILGGVYSALVVAGGINAQNLESRAWAIAGSVMALLPLNTLGLMVVTSLIANYLFGAILEDPDFASYVAMIFMGLEYLISVGIGAWCLKTLFDQEVIDGFEFEPE
ncbi:MAG: hypothetical protein U0797_02705 [Gemmataceae bacterium]